MKDQFKFVLDNYLIEKRNQFAQNSLANFIRSDLVKDIVKLSRISNNYLVTGSAGQGNWAEIPWVCVFDKDITKSAQHGYYIVYLFNSEMKGIYLSLNQGWTQYEIKFGISNGREEIKKSADIFRSILRSNLYDFSFEPINLNTNNILGIGYELGHIYGVFYPTDNIPDDGILIDDLRNLIGVYREVKGIVGKNVFDLKLVYDLDENDEEVEPTPKEKLEINKKFVDLETEEDINNALAKLELELQNKDPKTRRRMATAIARNKKVSDLIKKKAKYICSICGRIGFVKKNGGLYAEAHHKEELAISLKDIPSNVICVCPTCHRVIHYGNNESYNKRLNLK